MKLFECQDCGQLLYFENTRCERCGHVLGYLSESAVLSALARKDGDRWCPLAAPLRLVRICANASYDACNWLVPAEGPDAFCRAINPRFLPEPDRGDIKRSGERRVAPGHRETWRLAAISR